MKKTVKINHLIFDKIKFRYQSSSFGRAYIPGKRREKTLLDTFYPYMIMHQIANNRKLYQNLFELQKMPCISERVAEDIGARKLHISELISMLGYTKTDISKLLQAVKNKGYNLVLIGAGGTGSNFLHWLYEMANFTGKRDIFVQISVYDDDEYDIPNMLRIPFIPDFSKIVNNIPEFSTKKVHCLPDRFYSLATLFEGKDRLFEEKDIDNMKLYTKRETIIYGAPGIETRTMLSEKDVTFIAATHRDDEFSLVENPSVDNDLMMETYGKINLSKFFLNHLLMTIKFLEHLRDRTEPFGTTAENVILRENFNQLFKEQLKNGFKAGSKRIYVHGNIEHEIILPNEGV